MCTLNDTSAARCLNTFAFSTLYMSIPHNSFKSSMKELIQDAFKVRGALYLSITRSGKCFWSSENKYKCNITAVQLIHMIYYLIDNIYVSVGNKVFCQCIGIPMGTDCAPLLANLYLFHFEYMRKLICSNMCKARSFCTTFWYIDGLVTLNNPPLKVRLMKYIHRNLY